jgi:hypothetical protein
MPANETSRPSDRRVHPRHEVHFPVLIRSAEQSCMGVARNASRSGMLIATPRPIEVGTETTLWLRGGEEGAAVAIDAVVVRSVEGAKTPTVSPQMAVRFMKPNADLDIAFERAEAARTPPTPTTRR